MFIFADVPQVPKGGEVIELHFACQQRFEFALEPAA
jgi:hypothetical protein